MCEDDDEQFIRLILHTDIRWLSEGACLSRFVALYDSIMQFFEENREGVIYQQLKMVEHDAFYLADIFKRFNQMNLQLQGSNKTLISCENSVYLFVEKLEILHRNLPKREFYQFPELLLIKEDITPEEIERFSFHIAELKINMKIRFKDFLNLVT